MSDPGLHLVEGDGHGDASAHSGALVALDGDPGISEVLGRPAHKHHIVQFYEDEGFLVENVARFLAAGLAADEPAVVIATAAHRTTFVERLALLGIEVDELRRRGRLVLLDADETLRAILVDGMPSWDRFLEVVGSVIERSRMGRDTPVRAYGEMVDLLWRSGDRASAIALEGMWNDLASTHSFSLLCAYVMGNFYKTGDGEDFREICRTHSHVLPTEHYARLVGEDNRGRAIGILQQRARSLEHELEQRKELEAALRDALAREKVLRHEAERTIRFNEMFAGMLGHDLRNPLGAITMGANFIARSNASEKTTKAANRIVSSAERMARMIDQLLDFTRIRIGGGLALNYTRLDLSEVCARVKDEHEAANPDTSIRVAITGDCVGFWDYDRLLQVFSNLVGNAIAHGSSGCVVAISAAGGGDDVLATVHNAGVVPPEILPVIFEPFRGSKKQLRTQGLGLGLFITRQILLAHGGAIEVDSSEASGTTMRVRLPRTPPVARP